MLKEGDMYEYIAQYTKELEYCFVIIDISNAPIYYLMNLNDSTYMYEDEDRLTNEKLYRILA
jgi:hypothetical protein